MKDASEIGAAVSGQSTALTAFRLPRSASFVALLCLLYLALAPAAAHAQQRDDAPNLEPAPAATDSVISIKAIRRGPRNALLWSAIPGGGQVYNKRYWKAPVVYAGLLGAVAYAEFNQTQYNRFVRALENRCLGDGNVIIPPNANCIVTEDEFTGIGTGAIRQARDNADRARQTAYIGIFLVYVLQAVEAYTDAHLQEFDISDDLSLRLGPVSRPGAPVGYGLTASLSGAHSLERQRARVRQLNSR